MSGALNLVVCLRAPPPDPEGDALGRADALALAHALGLAGAAHKVTALLGGTSTEAGPLRLALGAGVDRAVRVAADELGAADFHTIGQVLAIAIRRIGADLILTGVRSDDEGLGAAPAAIARHLGVAYLPCVEEIAFVDGPAVEVVTRGGGRLRRLRVKLPAVLTIAAGPGPVTARAPRTGDAPPIEVIPLSDPESTVVRRRTELLGRPEPASRGVETVTSAAALVAALARR
jgi:electron transfer flavoprotein alpha/beta subunit